MISPSYEIPVCTCGISTESRGVGYCLRLLVRGFRWVEYRPRGLVYCPRFFRLRISFPTGKCRVGLLTWWFLYLFLILAFFYLLIVTVERCRRTWWHSTTHTHIYSVGLLWTSDRPDAETSTRQHTTLTRDRNPYCRWDSKPQSQTHAFDRTATGIGNDNYRPLISQSIHRHFCDDIIKNGRQLKEKQSCCERRASCSVARWWSVVTMIWGPSLDGPRPVYVFQNPSYSQHPGVTKRVDQHMRASSSTPFLEVKLWSYC